MIFSANLSFLLKVSHHLFVCNQKLIFVENGPLKSLLYKAVQKPRNVRPQKPNLIKLGIRPEDILGTENVHSH
jgi:hypothetical protein